MQFPRLFEIFSTFRTSIVEFALVNLVLPARIAEPILTIETFNRMDNDVLADATFELFVDYLVEFKAIFDLCEILPLQEQTFTMITFDQRFLLIVFMILKFFRLFDLLRDGLMSFLLYFFRVVCRHNCIIIIAITLQQGLDEKWLLDVLTKCE